MNNLSFLQLLEKYDGEIRLASSDELQVAWAQVGPKANFVDVLREAKAIYYKNLTDKRNQIYADK